MAITTELIELITKHVGRFSTDILTGWEAGLQGKRRAGGRLVVQSPPEHFQGGRYHDWLAGHDAAVKYKASRCRETRFSGIGPAGAIIVLRKGWIARNKVITQMEKAGAYGDVYVDYLEQGEIKRTVNCGI